MDNLIELIKEFYEDSKFIVKDKKIKKARKEIKAMVKDIEKDPTSISKYVEDEE